MTHNHRKNLTETFQRARNLILKEKQKYSECMNERDQFLHSVMGARLLLSFYMACAREAKSDLPEYDLNETSFIEEMLDAVLDQVSGAEIRQAFSAPSRRGGPRKMPTKEIRARVQAVIGAKFLKIWGKSDLEALSMAAWHLNKAGWKIGGFEFDEYRLQGYRDKTMKKDERAISYYYHAIMNYDENIFDKNTWGDQDQNLLAKVFAEEHFSNIPQAK